MPHEDLKGSLRLTLATLLRSKPGSTSRELEVLLAATTGIALEKRRIIRLLSRETHVFASEGSAPPRWYLLEDLARIRVEEQSRLEEERRRRGREEVGRIKAELAAAAERARLRDERLLKKEERRKGQPSVEPIRRRFGDATTPFESFGCECGGRGCYLCEH
jgi:hypothetical protein